MVSFREVVEVLRGPLDREALVRMLPELGLARGLTQSPYHHLDTLEHILETVRCVRRELEDGSLGARVPADRFEALLFAALMHDVAKPLTRGEVEGRVVFVAHDTLGARMVERVCLRLGAPAMLSDLARTLTHLHLKIGFMENPRTDYPPERIVRAAGPFCEELAVLSWADRLSARGPRLRKEHIERHRRLCARFIEVGRTLGPCREPDYEGLSSKLAHPPGAVVGAAASRLRILRAGGMEEEEAFGRVWSAAGVLHKEDR